MTHFDFIATVCNHIVVFHLRLVFSLSAVFYDSCFLPLLVVTAFLQERGYRLPVIVMVVANVIIVRVACRRRLQNSGSLRGFRSLRSLMNLRSLGKLRRMVGIVPWRLRTKHLLERGN